MNKILQVGRVFCGLLFIVILQINASVDKDHQWSYGQDSGPDKWFNQYPQCKGERQSPIDIQSKKLVRKSQQVIQYSNYDLERKGYTWKIENNGHTVKLSLPPYIFGLRLYQHGALYKMFQLHFHWGSEHTINGQRQDLEMHIVHYKARYLNPTQAMKHSDGLVVLVVLFTVGEENEALTPIVNMLPMLNYPRREGVIDYFPLGNLLPDDQYHHIRYKGSLTTPPCSEIATFLILCETMTVSANQIQAFQSIHSSPENVLKNNFRPVQPINDRLLYHNCPKKVINYWNEHSKALDVIKSTTPSPTVEADVTSDISSSITPDVTSDVSPDVIIKTSQYQLCIKLPKSLNEAENVIHLFTDLYQRYTIYGRQYPTNQNISYLSEIIIYNIKSKRVVIIGVDGFISQGVRRTIQSKGSRTLFPLVVLQSDGKGLLKISFGRTNTKMEIRLLKAQEEKLKYLQLTLENWDLTKKYTVGLLASISKKVEIKEENLREKKKIMNVKLNDNDLNLVKYLNPNTEKPEECWDINNSSIKATWVQSNYDYYIDFI